MSAQFGLREAKLMSGSCEGACVAATLRGLNTPARAIGGPSAYVVCTARRGDVAGLTGRGCPVSCGRTIRRVQKNAH